MTQGTAKADLSQAEASQYGPNSQSAASESNPEMPYPDHEAVFNMCMLKSHQGIWGYRLVYSIYLLRVNKICLQHS